MTSPINFVVMTDTPVRLKNFLLSRGVIKESTDMRGDPILVGARPGMEWIEVPNPIITDPGSGTPGEPGYVPPTRDTRNVYLVQFHHESAENEVEGPVYDQEGMPNTPFDWSKFGKWVKNNSSVVSAPAGWTVQGEPVGDAYKINGESVWLVRDRPERFVLWQ
jgi:hypothetical protein